MNDLKVIEDLIRHGMVLSRVDAAAFLKEFQRLKAEAETLRGGMCTLKDKLQAAQRQIDDIKAERDRLKDLLWTPHTKDFLEAVKIEAAHQRDRWGDDHDKMKSDADWYWTLGWLAGKAVRHESQEKRLHHIVTSTALLLNWHRFASEDTTEAADSK